MCTVKYTYRTRDDWRPTCIGHSRSCIHHHAQSHRHISSRCLHNHLHFPRHSLCPGPGQGHRPPSQPSCDTTRPQCQQMLRARLRQLAEARHPINLMDQLHSCGHPSGNKPNKANDVWFKSTKLLFTIKTKYIKIILKNNNLHLVIHGAQ